MKNRTKKELLDHIAWVDSILENMKESYRLAALTNGQKHLQASHAAYAHSLELLRGGRAEEAKKLVDKHEQLTFFQTEDK